MKKITKTTVNSIIRNGGATINRHGVRVSMRTGYQVSKCDLYIIPVEQLDKYILISAMQQLTSKSEYVGVWIDNGSAYIDISCRIATKHKAMQAGRELNQLSILRWADMECLAVK
jgi:hypothetical protein